MAAAADWLAVAALLGTIFALVAGAVALVARQIDPPRRRRDVLPPIPRRCLDALPASDDDGTR